MFWRNHVWLPSSLFPVVRPDIWLQILLFLFFLTSSTLQCTDPGRIWISKPQIGKPWIELEEPGWEPKQQPSPRIFLTPGKRSSHARQTRKQIVVDRNQSTWPQVFPAAGRLHDPAGESKTGDQNSPKQIHRRPERDVLGAFLDCIGDAWVNSGVYDSRVLGFFLSGFQMVCVLFGTGFGHFRPSAARFGRFGAFRNDHNDCETRSFWSKPIQTTSKFNSRSCCSWCWDGMLLRV